MGIGSFFYGVTGRTIILTWSMQRCVEAGVCWDDEMSFLEGMTGGAAAAKKHMTEGATVVCVREGEIMWVPYGYHVWIIAETDDSTVIAQPVFDKALIAKVEPRMKKMIVDNLMEYVKNQGDKVPVSIFGQNLKRHFEKVLVT